jgi:hypothetical protein
MKKKIKLSEWARYTTTLIVEAYNVYKRGDIVGYQTPYFVSIVTSFCARLYGKRRSKRKTEKLIENLTKND